MAAGASRLDRAAVVASAGVLALGVGCSSGHEPALPSTVVSVDGRIGPLRIGRSDAGAVIAFAGRPDAVRRGREFDSALYRALGYGCSSTGTDLAFPLLQGGPYCRTVFFINARTQRLGTFFTTSAHYSEGDGVRMGMATAVAERLLHVHVYVGCEENVSLGTREADLTIAFAGGTPRGEAHSAGLRLIGGHVYAVVLHSPRNDVGVFDCS